LGFRVQASWSLRRVEGLGFRVKGPSRLFFICRRGGGVELRISGFRVPISGFRVEVSGFGVPGPGFRVQSLGFGVWGLGLKM
jgi:hypothetical protein